MTVGIESEDGGLCSISVGHGEYDTDNKTITVGLKLEIDEIEGHPTPPFLLTIEIVATFKVDETKFNRDNIIDFARRNAPYIMMPYLREHAYALTAKCGFKPIVLPLTEVPTVKPKP